MKPYRAAVVGLGNVAWKFDLRVNSKDPLTHAQAYRNNPNIVLVGGCSPDAAENAAFAKHYDVAVFSGIEELIKHAKPDIVSICSPSDLHFQHARYCIDAGVPMIWLEKPPACDIEQLDILIKRLGASPSSRILVNYQRRYARCYNRLRQLLKGRALGRLIFCHLTYSRGLMLNGSHIIDAAFFLLGDLEAAHLEFAVHSSGNDSPSFMFKFSDGTPCFVAGLSLPYHCRDVSLTGEYARASIVQEGLKTRWEIPGEQELYPGYYRLREADENPIGSGGLDGCMPGALDDLIQSYRQRRDPLSSLFTARKAQALIEEALRQTGCVV